ncbi:type VII secretion protein EccE [Longispora fulva]|uniref:Type VII secretion protein EccE n=1 Tax=Longispora fulva TaxID=619741 RepID=A0A8J7GVX7_9ACTN|nr:type VII secretion protein EccE [Longispora fulva]MBG6140585.1 type VII secretion protein EccE [Longispora fulva]
MSLLQLLAMEVVGATVLVLLTHNLIVGLASATVATVALVVLFGRSQGRWWTERLRLRWQLRKRRTSVAHPSPDRRLAALSGLVPDLTVRTVPDSAGSPVGVAHDGSGWFAVITATPDSGMRGDSQATMPLASLARALSGAEQPGGVIQVVTHSVPTPSSGLPGHSPASQSYRELTETLGRVPADRNCWVTVRLDARLLAEATDGPAGGDETVALLLALVRRVGKALRRSGVPYRVLDSDGLLDAMVRSLDLEPPAHDTGVPRPQEQWQSWHSAGLAHACFWLRDWPQTTQIGPLLDSMAASPAALTSVATILQPTEEGIDIRCLVRVANPEPRLAEATQAVQAAASQAGGRLFRLDGEHASAVYASAPTGGGAR